MTAPPGYGNGGYTGWQDLTSDIKTSIRGYLPEIDGQLMNIARTGATMSTTATDQLEFVSRLCKLCSIITQITSIAAIKISGPDAVAEVSYCRQLDPAWQAFDGQPGHFRVWVHDEPAFQLVNDNFTRPEQVAQYLLPLGHRMQRMRYPPLVYEAPSWRLVNEDSIT